MYQHGAGRNCKCLIFNTYPILYYTQAERLIDQDWQRCHPVYTKGVLMKHLIGPILAFMRGPV